MSHEDGSPSKWLRELQTQLGVAIDVAEDMYGATTRQVGTTPWHIQHTVQLYFPQAFLNFTMHDDDVMLHRGPT